MGARAGEPEHHCSICVRDGEPAHGELEPVKETTSCSMAEAAIGDMKSCNPRRKTLPPVTWVGEKKMLQWFFAGNGDEKSFNRRPEKFQP
jgi:hypothetical protein